MKFWKILSKLIEVMLPDWRDEFLSYKDLKKELNFIYGKEGESCCGGGDSCRPNKRLRFSGEAGDPPEAAGDCVVADGGEREDEETKKKVVDFAMLLEQEVEKFNAFFEDKEEYYVIRLKVVQDRVAEAKGSDEELMEVGRDIVDLHGEMVLLENYSALNYIGLVKILKKYDKKTGALLRLPFIQKVLQEPFFKTDLLKELVRECETMLKLLFSLNKHSSPSLSTANEASSSELTVAKEGCDIKTENEEEAVLKAPEELAEIKNVESKYGKLAMMAIETLIKIRKGSSTVNMFSLPPLQVKGMEEAWKKAPASVLEEVAK